MQRRTMAVSASSSSMVIDNEEKPHVLAVDDSLVDRKIINRLLTTSSCKVENGQKAMESLGLVEGQYSNSTRETNINLIITDYCMPGMTGYDLLKRVKGSSNLKEIPVVIGECPHPNQEVLGRRCARIYAKASQTISY